MKVEVVVVGSPSLIVCTVRVDVKQYVSGLRRCEKVEEAVLRSPSLKVLMVCVDVKQH